MEQKDIWAVYSHEHKRYFGGTIGQYPAWVTYLSDCYWFRTKEKAENAIKKHNLPQTEIIECVATYPKGQESFLTKKHER